MNARLSFIQSAIASVEADIQNAESELGTSRIWRHREHAYLCSLLLLVAHPSLLDAQEVDLANLDALLTLVHAHPTHPATQLVRHYLLSLPGMRLDASGTVYLFDEKQARAQHEFIAERSGMMPFPSVHPAKAA